MMQPKVWHEIRRSFSGIRWLAVCAVGAMGLLLFVQSVCVDTASAVEPNARRISLAQSSPEANEHDPQSDSQRLAQSLVDQHLPELKPVLASLKKHSKKEYQKAIADLERMSRRLQSLQKRDEPGYEIELAFLQWQTRADLALAELAVRDTAKTRDQLKQALIQREQARTVKMKHERERLVQRIERMQEQVGRLDQQIEDASAQAVAQQAFEQATRRLNQKQEASKKKSQL